MTNAPSGRAPNAGAGLGPPCVGVLLAAGRGRRAGGAKQLLPWATPGGMQTLVSASFDAVAWVCPEMVVVLGHEAARVRAALGARAFVPVEVDPDAPMSESVRAGLAAARSRWQQQEGPTPGSGSPWTLLHLGDHPSVAAPTIHRLLVHARDAATGPAPAIIPEYRGRGGHPALIPPAVAARIIDAPLEGGLRRFWIENPALCRRVRVADPGVAHDLDRLPGGTPSAKDGAGIHKGAGVPPLRA